MRGCGGLRGGRGGSPLGGHLAPTVAVIVGAAAVHDSLLSGHTYLYCNNKYRRYHHLKIQIAVTIGRSKICATTWLYGELIPCYGCQTVSTVTLGERAGKRECPLIRRSQA
jgi:hypothetical protein